MTLPDESALWAPDITFINSKTTIVHSSPIVNSYASVHANGTVWQSQRMMISIPCSLDINLSVSVCFLSCFTFILTVIHSFSRFPFDEVTCETTIQSFRFDDKQISLQWSTYPVVLFKELSLTGFKHANYSVVSVNQVRKRKKMFHFLFFQC